MTASDITIKIYNQQTLRVDKGEVLIKEYAMKVAEEAYRQGFNDAQSNQNPKPRLALAGLNFDTLNTEEE